MSDHTEDPPEDEADDDKRRRAAGIVGAGAAGAVAGGLGSAALTGDAIAAHGAAVGPGGVPLNTGAATGSTGVQFGQGAAGSSGVPLGQGTAGPTGVPMATPAGVGPSGATGATGAPRGLRDIVRAHMVPVAVGAAVVATLGVGAVVLAARNDDSPGGPAAVTPTVEVTAAETSPSAGVAPSTTVAPAVVAVPATVIETSPSSAPVLATEPGLASCVVGSWTPDNQVFGYSFGGPDASNQITGAMRVDIAADGSVVTTYDNWVLTADVQGVSETVSLTGADTNTITFSDDGSYSVTATQIGSHMISTAGGITAIDGPSLQAEFQGSGTFTCTGDHLEMVLSGTADAATFSRTG
jgi:hypothetical protein